MNDSSKDPGFRPVRDVVERPVRDDVAGELDFHLDMATRELEACGWEPSAARAEAERRFGDRSQHARACERLEFKRRRAGRRADMFDELRTDLKFAFRQMKRRPAFTAAALLTLSLGIGAVSIMVTLVDGVLLRPLPYPEPHRIVNVWEKAERGHDMRIAYPNAVDWIQQSESFSTAAFYDGWIGDATITGIERPVNAQTVSVSASFFDVFGVPPHRGRTFDAAEQTLGGSPAAMVSHDFWQRHLAGAPLSGQSIELYGEQTPVVGVMPPDFSFPPGTEVWTPAGLSAAGTSRTAHNWALVARLADGKSLADAQAEMSAIVARQVSLYGDDMDAKDAVVRAILEQQVGSARRTLLLLGGAALLVLLLAASNLVSAQIARTMDRSDEMALRGALGAGGARLIRQLLTEGAVSSLLGGVLGVGLAYGALRALKVIGGDRVPRLAEASVDGRVLVVTLVIAGSVGLLFGLLPALFASRTDVRSVLGEARAQGHAQNRVWNRLLVGEVALALLLLTGSLVLLQELWRLLDRSPGFETDGVITAEVAAHHVVFPTIDDLEASLAAEAEVGVWQATVLEQLQVLPAAEHVGLINNLPLTGADASGTICFGAEMCWEDESRQGYASYRIVGGDYFAALQIPLLEGRHFRNTDDSDGEFVAIVNRAFAERYGAASKRGGVGPAQEVLGTVILSGGMDYHGLKPTRIVGVVGDVFHRGLDEPARPEIYYPMQQRPRRALYARYVLRARSRPEILQAQLEDLLRTRYPDVPLEVRSLESVRLDSVTDRRFTFVVLCSFALVAFGLALTGIWAVTTYRVAMRQREIGIRMAIGLQRRGVLRLVLSGVARCLALGIVLGGALTGVFYRLLGEQLPQQPRVVAMIAIAALLLALLGLVAGWLPARRATRIDPRESMSA